MWNNMKKRMIIKNEGDEKEEGMGEEEEVKREVVRQRSAEHHRIMP